MRVTLEDFRGLDFAFTSFELNLSAELSLISHLQHVIPTKMAKSL